MRRALAGTGVSLWRVYHVKGMSGTRYARHPSMGFFLPLVYGRAFSFSLAARIACGDGERGWVLYAVGCRRFFASGFFAGVGKRGYVSLRVGGWMDGQGGCI